LAVGKMRTLRRIVLTTVQFIVYVILVFLFAVMLQSVLEQLWG